jgi:hypothetical protein
MAPAPNNTEPLNRGLAAQRAAETLLQTLGGTEIYVRVALDAVMSDDQQLGLDSPATEEILISPVVVRNLTTDKSIRVRLEILVAARTLARVRELYTVSDALDFFNGALGVIQRGKLFQVDSVDADEYGGYPYLYRLRLSE